MLNHNLIKKIMDELAFIHHKERSKLVLDELNEFEHSHLYNYHSFEKGSRPKLIRYAYTSTSFSNTSDKYRSVKEVGPWKEWKCTYTAPNDSILYERWKNGELIEEYTVDLTRRARA